MARTLIVFLGTALVMGACARAPAALVVLPGGAPVRPKAEPQPGDTPRRVVLPQVAPGGTGRLALVADDGQIVLVDAQDGRRLMTGPRAPWDGRAQPRITRNGRYMTYTSQQLLARRLVVWDIGSEREVKVPEDVSAVARAPDLSDDGRFLIYLSGPGWDAALCLCDLRTGETRELTLPSDRNKGLAAPTLSGDGRIAAFEAASRENDMDITLLDVASGRPLSPPTLNTPRDERDPVLDRTGQRLVFSSNRNGDADLYAYDLARSRFLTLVGVNTLSDETAPRLLGADDGLVFVSTRDGEPALYAVPLAPWR